MRLVPESRDPEPGAFDLVGAGLSVATLVTLVYGIIEATPRGWTDPLVLGCFARRRGARRRVHRLGAPGRRRRCCRCGSSATRASPSPRVGVGLVFFAMMGSIFAFTQFLQFAHGFSALEAGAAMLPLALGLVIGSGASNQLAGRARAARA